MSFSKNSFEVNRGINQSGDNYSVALNFAPAFDVEVSPVVDDTTGASLVIFNPASLKFTSANWQTPQIISLEPTEQRVNFSQANYQLKHIIVSQDSDYQGLVIGNKVLSVINRYGGGGGTGSGEGTGGGSGNGGNSGGGNNVGNGSNTIVSNNQNTGAVSQENNTDQGPKNYTSQQIAVNLIFPNSVSAISNQESSTEKQVTNPFPGRVFILNTGRRAEAGRAIKNILIKEVEQEELEEISVVELSTLARFVAFGTSITNKLTPTQRAKAIVSFLKLKNKLPITTLELLEMENLALTK